MKTITHGQLVALVESTQGTAIAGIETTTQEKLNKTGNPYPSILKRCRGVVTIGADYQAGVRREAERQDVNAETFNTSSLPWGEWLVDGKVIAHRGAYYLRTQSTPRQRSAPQVRVLGYFTPKGQAVAKSAIERFMPPKRESKKQTDAGLTQTVWPRNYKFDSINRIRIAGNTYEVIAV